MSNSAFTAHLLGAGSGTSYDEYLKNVGLGENANPEPNISADDAIAKAESILKKAREKKINGNI